MGPPTICWTEYNENKSAKTAHTFTDEEDEKMDPLDK